MLHRGSIDQIERTHKEEKLHLRELMNAQSHQEGHYTRRDDVPIGHRV